MPVRFSEDNEIFVIPNNEEEDRSIGSMYYRELINNCEIAEREIVKMINDNCTNKIILITEGYPLTIRDQTIPWYLDNTVCKIHNHMLTNKDFREYFYKLFDNEIDNNMKMFDISAINLIIDDVHFYFNKVMRMQKL